jgi:hypothetical protein
MLLPDAIPSGLPTLNDDPSNGRSYANLLSRVQSLAEQHAQRVDAIENTVSKHVDSLLEQYSGLTRGTMTDDLRNGIKLQVRQKAQQDGREFRAGEVAKHSVALDQLEKDAYAAEQQISALVSAIGDCPAGLIGYRTLTDPAMRDKRSSYAAALQHAGHAELRNAAVTAAGSNDWAMAAAVLSILDKLPREHRPLHPAELASKIAGPLYTRLATARDTARLTVSKMFEARRVLRTGSSNSVRKIAHGLRELEIAKEAAGNK